MSISPAWPRHPYLPGPTEQPIKHQATLTSGWIRTAVDDLYIHYHGAARSPVLEMERDQTFSLFLSVCSFGGDFSCVRTEGLPLFNYLQEALMHLWLSATGWESPAERRRAPLVLFPITIFSSSHSFTNNVSSSQSFLVLVQLPHLFTWFAFPLSNLF